MSCNIEKLFIRYVTILMYKLKVVSIYRHVGLYQFEENKNPLNI